jgi:hypothetical protein
VIRYTQGDSREDQEDQGVFDTQEATGSGHEPGLTPVAGKSACGDRRASRLDVVSSTRFSEQIRKGSIFQTDQELPSLRALCLPGLLTFLWAILLVFLLETDRGFPFSLSDGLPIPDLSVNPVGLENLFSGSPETL